MKEQSEAMRESVKAAERGLEIAQENTTYAQRAYVTVTAYKIITEAGSTLLQMKIRNSGNTPAHKVRIFVAMECLEQPPTPDNNPPNWTGIGVIAPHRLIANYIGIKYEDNFGPGILYCWGVIRYESFGHTWHTRFSFVRKQETAFGRCEEGNEAE
jgi:hypothetical protein